ncbi:MAG: GHKL domain-containing protein [Chlorobi bacterium]|nr:GHKL domain-containing protein [Chlorobiota bacterium]
MIKKYKYIIFLISAGVFFVLSYSSYRFSEKESQYKLDVNKIQKRISELDKQSEILLNKFYKTLLSDRKKLKNKHHTNLFDILKISNPENFIVLIYQNDTLKFWSDNSFPANSILKAYKNKKIIHAQNGWYRSKTKENKETVIICLYRIKNNYFYENKFLKSNFTIGLKIPSSVVVSTSPISVGKNIKDAKGSYLFSLIPSNNIVDKKPNYELPFFLFVLTLIFLLLASHNLISKTHNREHSYFVSFTIWILNFIVFFIIVKYQFPKFISSSIFFSTELYAGNFPFSNIGNLVISSFFIVFTARNFFNIIPVEYFFEKHIIKNKIYTFLFSAGCFLFCAFLFIKTSNLLKNIILNSNMSFDIQKIIKPDINAILSFLSISIIFLSVIYITDLFLKLFARLTTFRISLISLLVSSPLLLLIFPLFLNSGYFISIISSVIIIFILLIIRYYKEEYNYFLLLLPIAGFTIFSVLFINNLEQKKEQTKQKVLIKQLANDTDPMAERFLKEINERLNTDTVLLNKITNVSENQDLEIYDYLKRKYFYGFWERYDLEISLCGNTEFYRDENQAENCEGYYNLEIGNFGDKIRNTKFWLMHYNTGKITWLGIIEVPVKADKRKMSLYITLSEKLTTKVLGYPALLIDKSTKTKTEYRDYSYAKYSNGILAVKFGDYPYELTDKKFKKKNKTEYYIYSHNYSHLVYSESDKKRIVLSKEKQTFFDKIISFTYLFVFYNMLIISLVIFYDSKYILIRFRFDFKNKIRFSMIFILLISFILFGTGTIYFTVKQNEKTGNREMEEKVQSVLIELKHKLQYEDELTPNWHTEQYDHLDELLNKFSQVFFADINLYDLNGFILASSRSEIFNRGLIGKEMNPKAYYELISEGKTEYIQTEHIGKMEYSSVYIPLRNEKNKITAFINLPYFSDNNKVKKNISDVFITTVNLYLVLFLITAFLSVLISEQITKPLTLLQNKFKSVQLGKKHTQIIYTKKDEIGSLVKEYNLMVAKLEESAKKLAESERESAWREMAKQIAHEIKNPLTPMKLSIQLLQKTWYDKTNTEEEFQKRLNSVAQTLIEQINTLSSIASEFSAFAKMPKARKEEVEIVKKLKNVTALFENEDNINISLNLNNIDELYIIADKEQISRVFINLVKNAVQAIPKNKKGEIKISLKNEKNKAVVVIKDNGKGITESQKKQLFEPSFTTKTKGMGIGLAIVKNIITSAGGNISFESKENKGTAFIVEFITV